MTSACRESGRARLLAVSWAMPPMLFPRALQVPRLLSALAQAGWQVTVVHADERFAGGAPRDPELTCRTRTGFEALRVGLPAPLDRPLAYRLLLRARLGEAAWEHLAARSAGRLIRRNAFHALATFAQPWSDHRVGLVLRRRYRLPWVAHFSDPWVDNPLSPARSGRQLASWRAQEEAVIRQADAVVFTTDFTRELVMRKYPEAWRVKAFVVPHGYDPALRDQIPETKPTGRLRMVYTGNFYQGRTPEPLLEALRELARERPLGEELEVLLVGSGNEAYAPAAAARGLAGIVEFRRPVPYLESLRLAASADVLLVIDAPSEQASVFLPSKLIDYLLFEKPILGITPLRGASAQLLRELGCPVAAPDDVAGIRAAIAGLLERRRAGALQVSPAFRDVAARYEISHVGRAFDEILRRVAAAGRSLS